MNRFVITVRDLTDYGTLIGYEAECQTPSGTITGRATVGLYPTPTAAETSAICQIVRQLGAFTHLEIVRT